MCRTPCTCTVCGMGLILTGHGHSEPRPHTTAAAPMRSVLARRGPTRLTCPTMPSALGRSTITRTTCSPRSTRGCSAASSSSALAIDRHAGFVFHGICFARMYTRDRATRAIANLPRERHPRTGGLLLEHTSIALAPHIHHRRLKRDTKLVLAHHLDFLEEFMVREFDAPAAGS